MIELHALNALMLTVLVEARVKEKSFIIVEDGRSFVGRTVQLKIH